MLQRSVFLISSKRSFAVPGADIISSEDFEKHQDESLPWPELER